MEATDLTTQQLAKLRAPFPANQVSKLPKETKAQKEEREKDRSKGVSCNICGGWHHKNTIHLDYVGHAALTDRLLDVDPMWSWEPVAFRDGLPAFDQTGGLWIKLTVCGVTRLGYGHAAGKTTMDPGAREKEVIGDALRNAAMRFGAALDLWHKGDLHAHEESAEETEAAKPPKVQPQRAAKPEPHNAPPASNPVDRTAEAVPWPNNQDPDDWAHWRKIVATKINRAGSAVEVGQVQAINAEGLVRCGEVLPDTREKIDAFVADRLAKLAEPEHRVAA
jgi:hypothetical protein